MHGLPRASLAGDIDITTSKPHTDVYEHNQRDKNRTECEVGAQETL